MHVKKDLTNLANKIALCCIHGNVVDFDMHNLFPPNTLLEEMEEAAEGAHIPIPQRTLREQQYKSQPLMILPDYSGDFLKKLQLPYEGKAVEASSEENLWDFSMPSEMLKHQEQPYPREILDGFYEFNRPGYPIDNVLKEYWDRAWEPNECPEMSEDKWERYGSLRVIKAFLSEITPSIRTAATLEELSKSRIKGKSFDPNRINGVSAVVKIKRPKLWTWSFNTSSGKNIYTTTFQFIPSSSIRDPKRLHVRVSCSCPSWVFWGAQFNAERGNYLYGPVRLKFAPPNKRDPNRQFLVCKHVLACIPLVSKFILPTLSREVKKRIEKEPALKIEKGPKEKLRIPDDLQYVADLPAMKDIEDTWDDMSPVRRKQFIMGLKTPDEVAYMAHRYPDTATRYVVPKLMAMAKKKNTVGIKAQELLEDIQETKPSRPSKPSLPPLIRNFGLHPEIQQITRNWEKMSPNEREKTIDGLTAPGSLAYLAYKFPDTAPEFAVPRLNEIAKGSRLPTERMLAKRYQHLAEKLMGYLI